jgi:hypothetical protein
MAGQLKVDSINADSNLSFRIANTAVAFIDSNGLRPTSGNVSLDSTGTTGVRSPAANTLVFYTAGTEDVRVTSAGDVGVGTSSPEAKFHISGTGDLYAKVESTGSQAGIKFETTTAGTSEYGILADSSEALRFYDFKNGSEPVRFNRYGIGLGGTTPSSGIGIAFPSTQSASTDANTLDDYEEGTFTPTISYTGGTTGTQTYTNQKAKYVKIGKLVTVNVQIEFEKNTLSGGYLDAINTLPFTASALSGLTSHTFAGWYNPSGTAFINVMGYINTGQAKIYLYRMVAANIDTAPLPISVAEMGTRITFYLSIFYYTD